MITFDNVSFSYGDKRILDNFSFTLNDGDKLCLLGESGVGKTTILRLLLGLEKANDGTITNDYNKISVDFQENRLLPYKTLEENISFFGGSNVDYILSALGLYESKNLYPSCLSGGMARRTSLARALSVEADLYILDEPFTGIDEKNIKKAIDLINKITCKKSLVIVTHQKEYAQMLNCKEIEIK